MADKLISLCELTGLPPEFHPDDVKWMEDIKPLDDFFSWIKNSVSEQNCITSDELRTYQILSESGKLFDDETLDEKHSRHLSGNVSVYPYQRDLAVLEAQLQDAEVQLAQLTDYEKQTKTSENTINNCKIEREIDKMLENEIHKLNSLIAGEFRGSVLTVASSFTSLNDKIRNISENVSHTGLISLSPLNSFCSLVEYLNAYVTSLIDQYKEVIEAEKGPSTDDTFIEDEFSSSEFIDSSLQRVFNDCVSFEIKRVQLLAGIEGIEEALVALDQSDSWLDNSRSSDQSDMVILEEELYTICYEHVKNMFLKNQVNITQQRLSRRMKVLMTFNELIEIAKPLRLCCDAITHLVLEEFKWVRVVKAIMSDCLAAIEEINLQIEHSHKQIRNLRTVYELSYTNAHDSGISANFLKLLCSSTDALNVTSGIGRSTMSSTLAHGNSTFHGHDKKVMESVMSKMFTGRFDSSYKMLQSFSSDAKNSLACIKTMYRYFFKGPSATPSLDTDLVSSIIQMNKQLILKEAKRKKLDYRYFELKVHRQNDLRNHLMDRFWLIYLENPLKLIQLVGIIEEEVEHLRNHHLALREGETDFLAELLP